MLVDVALLEVELVEEVVSTDDVVDVAVEDGEEDAEDDVESVEVVGAEDDVGEEVVMVDATDNDVVVVVDVVDFDKLRTPIAPAATIITTITITTSTVRPIPRLASSLKRDSSHRGVTRYITMFAFSEPEPRHSKILFSRKPVIIGRESRINFSYPHILRVCFRLH